MKTFQQLEKDLNCLAVTDSLDFPLTQQIALYILPLTTIEVDNLDIVPFLTSICVIFLLPVRDKSFIKMKA